MWDEWAGRLVWAWDGMHGLVAVFSLFRVGVCLLQQVSFSGWLVSNGK